jgi:hypothetical protein
MLIVVSYVSQSEVDQLRSGIAVSVHHEDIARFQIPVVNALLVRLSKCVQDHCHESHGAGGAESAVQA